MQPGRQQRYSQADEEPLGDLEQGQGYASRHPSGLFTIVIALAFGALPFLPFVERLELRTYDVRLHVRGPIVPSQRIVVVEVDDSTLLAWPEPRVAWGPRIASLMRALYAAGAKALGLDIVISADTDRYLADTDRRALRLAGLSPEAIARWESVTANTAMLHPNDALAQYLEERNGRVVLSTAGSDTLLPVLAATGVRTGDVLLAEQADDTVRTLAVSTPQGPTFVGALAATVNPREALPSGMIWINYCDDVPRRAFTIISAARVANLPSASLHNLVAGSVVLIGPNYRGSNDLHAGPYAREFTGTEILAHGLATLLGRHALRRTAHSTTAIASFLLTALGLWMFPRLRFRAGLFVITGAATLLLVSAQEVFDTLDLLIPVVVPICAVAGAFAIIHGGNAISERRLRLLMEQTFGRYAGSGVRDYLLASVRNRALGGRTIEATVLFFDLRGSTAFAETRTPQAVMDELNGLFSRLVPIVLAHEGMLLRYSGDGFIALFGAPAPSSRERSAEAAVAAAVKLVDHVSRQTRWACGIGINTGKMLFGSLGSADRPDFTIIGDAVNVAARLEAATKDLDCEIVLSQSSFETAGAPTGFDGPLEYTVRGRQNAMLVYVLRSHAAASKESAK